MSYFSPYIDGTGIHIPTFADIRDDLISSMRQIFGDDIYIDEDSMDYQQISIFAKKIYDTNNLALLVYNNRTANTAIGVGLDNICALVGITRKPATYSTVQITITGDPGTIINNGQVSDGTYIWNLPDQVTIPGNGVITVPATCSISGKISALQNTITTIVTPTFGWLSCTNNYTASPGTDVESDADLRARYYISTLSPSSSILESVLSSIESIDGVTRAVIYENDTNTNSAEGFPPHSITAVVEGGSDSEIAREILFKKTLGCATNGTTHVDVSLVSGLTTTINFYRPDYIDIGVKVTITKLSGWNDSYEDDIKSALVEYINNLSIADDVYNSMLLSTCVNQMLSVSSPAYVVTSIEMSKNGGALSPSDITCSFNEVAKTSDDGSDISFVYN